MIRPKTMRQIATSKTIPSFRSCPSNLNAWTNVVIDRARIATDQAQILANEIHRQWFNLARKRRHGSI